VIVLEIGFGPEFCNELSVNLDAARIDELFGFAP